MDIINSVFLRTAKYDAKSAHRIQHFTKVHNFARQIAIAENAEPKLQKVLELAAIVHDVGIRESLIKYGDDDGSHQEELGPDIARRLFDGLDITKEEVERICYLIGHHHTYHDIDGLDYQILVEADFLVNFFEGNYSMDSIKHTYETIFKTETGKEICRDMFL